MIFCIYVEAYRDFSDFCKFLFYMAVHVTKQLACGGIFSNHTANCMFAKCASKKIFKIG